MPRLLSFRGVSDERRLSSCSGNKNLSVLVRDLLDVGRPVETDPLVRRDGVAQEASSWQSVADSDLLG